MQGIVNTNQNDYDNFSILVQLFKIGIWQNLHCRQAWGFFSPADSGLCCIWRRDKRNLIRSALETVKQNNNSELNVGLQEALPPRNLANVLRGGNFNAN